MINLKNISKKNILIVLGLCFCTQIAYAQNTPQDLRDNYLTPPKDVKEAVLAPRYKNVDLSKSHLGPKRQYFIHYISKQGMSAISLYAKPYYNLGGLQIDPQANRRRAYTLIKGYSRAQTYAGLELIDARNGSTKSIQTPEGAHVSNAEWSPDGSKVAYFAHFDKGTYLYVADVNSGRSHRISKQPVLATLNTSFEWSGDSRHLFAVLVPGNRGEKPQKPAVALPQVRMTTNTQKRLRTYPNLLEGPYEIKLLKYYITGQLTQLDVENGQARKIGSPAMIRSIDAAPSGKYMVVNRLVEPFSYIVPVSRFADRKEIWNLEGKQLAVLRKRGIRKSIPDSSVTEKFNHYNVKWRPDGDGLSFIARPDKNKGNGNIVGDSDSYRIIQWMPPFENSDQHVVYQSDKRLRTVSYTADSDVLIVKEGSYRKGRFFAVYPGNTEKTYTIYKYNRNKFYKNPGRLIYKKSATGRSVVQLSSDKQSVFLSGTQYYKNPQAQAPRPFIDKVDIKSGDKERLFQSSKDSYQQAVAALDDDINKLVMTREILKSVPNAWLLNLNNGSKKKITSNVDYNTPISQATHKRFQVKRADGITFWVDVYLPKDWDGKPLPGVIYQYPREYDNQEDYNKSTRRYNKNKFSPGIKKGWPERTYRLLVTQGYAVVMADWPIVSNQGTPDDGLVWSIQQNSTALIDSLASRGYADRNRMAIVGHSFGGFGVVNAMVHTSFFKAGVAGDDTYNRTLTPFGFQHQRHILWNDLSKYIELSPLFWADHLDGALLIYHSADDQNVGTWPEQSWRLFKALNKLGKTASLYMYPYADHHTGAKEIVMDRWVRILNWLNHYVKNEGERVSEVDLGSASSH